MAGRQHMFALVRDATERKRAEELFRTLAQNSPVGIFLIQDRRFSFVNYQFQKDTGYAEAELLGEDSLALVHPDDRDKVRESVAETLRGELSSPYEYRGVRKSGESSWVVGTVAPISFGGRPAIAGTYLDITELKEAQEALSQQSRELAVLEERNRMAREIHDTLAQGFTGIVLQLEAAEQVSEQSPSEVKDHLGRAKDLARESLQEARRSVWDLLPRALEQRPLDTALRQEVDQFAGAGRETATFSISGDQRDLLPDIQTCLLRVCQESLTNVRRHARATEVQVNLSFKPAGVGLEVEDDGIGFDVDALKDEEGRPGFGLTGMEQRARLLGGTLAVESRKAQGTLVRVWIPTP